MSTACAVVIVLALSGSLAPPASAQSCTWGGSSTVDPPAATPLRSQRDLPRSPGRVAADSQANVYTTEPAAGRIVVRNRIGGVISVREGLLTPVAVAVDHSGDIYVGERDAGRVSVFDHEWNLTHQFGQGDGEFLIPNDIAIDPDPQRAVAYVADAGAHEVRVYSVGGALQSSFGGFGTDAGQFDFPAAVQVSAAGEVFVADQNNDRVQVFDRSGGFLRCFGRPGSFAFSRKFGSILGLTGDPQGRLYVADAFQGHIKVFDDQGVLLGTIGSLGQGLGHLRTPVGLVIDSYNRLFVASVNTSRVEVFGLDEFSDPACITDADCPSADGDPCTAEACTGGHCEPFVVEDGTPCEDGNLCNGTETCQGGSCTSGAPLDCDDGNACTADTCSAASGCIHTPVPGCEACGADADCSDDGDPCTTEVCVDGACTRGAAESAACSACDDCVDNDNDATIDGADLDCSTLAVEAPYALIGGANDDRRSVILGSWSHVAKVDGTGGCAPGVPFPGGPSEAAVCAGSTRVKSGAHVEGGLAVPSADLRFGPQSPAPAINGYCAASGRVQIPIPPDRQPLVGPPEQCDDGKTRCTRHTQCRAGKGTCLPLRRLGDPANPFVHRDGSVPELTRCHAARRALVTNAALIAGLTATEDTIDEILVNITATPSPCLVNPRDTCPTVTLQLGGGRRVLVVESLLVARRTQLILSGQPDTVAVVRVLGAVSVGSRAAIGTSGGLAPERILWSVEGAGPDVLLRARSRIVGTMIALDRGITLGRWGVVEGALFGNRVAIKWGSTVKHTPFVGVLVP